MIYAHVTAGTVDQVGTPPATGYAAGRWWDLRTLDPAALAACSWLPVVETPRPDDTATTTTDPGWTVGTTTVTRTWTPRPWTAAELTARDQQTVAATLRTGTTTDLAKVQQAITDLQTLLGDTTVTGSIRAVMGDPAAPSGTGSLRALRSQSNTAVISAASIKALIGLTIDLAQRVIDGDAATRRVARQTLRLARLTVGSLDSADVGH